MSNEIIEKSWIGFDFDGTLAEYEGWQGQLTFGKPIPLMVEFVKQCLEIGFVCKIVTARVANTPNKDGSISNIDAVISAIQDWTQEHIGARLEVTNMKDFNMICLYDDRAIQIIPNTGKRADGQPLRIW